MSSYVWKSSLEMKAAAAILSNKHLQIFTGTIRRRPSVAIGKQADGDQAGQLQASDRSVVIGLGSSPSANLPLPESGTGMGLLPCTSQTFVPDSSEILIAPKLPAGILQKDGHLEISLQKQ